MSNKIERLMPLSSFAHNGEKFIDILKDKLGIGKNKAIESIGLDLDISDVADKVVFEVEAVEQTAEDSDFADKESKSTHLQPVLATPKHGFSLAHSVHMPGKAEKTTVAFVLENKDIDIDLTIGKAPTAQIENIWEKSFSVVADDSHINLDIVSTVINSGSYAMTGNATPVTMNTALLNVAPLNTAAAVQQVPFVGPASQTIEGNASTPTTVTKSMPVVVQVGDPTEGVQLGTVTEQIMLDHVSIDSDTKLDVAPELLGRDDADLWDDDFPPPLPEMAKVETDAVVGIHTGFDVSLIPPPPVHDGPVPIIDTSLAPLPPSFVLHSDNSDAGTVVDANTDIDTTALEIVPPQLYSARVDFSASADSKAALFSPPPPPPPPPPKVGFSVATETDNSLTVPTEETQTRSMLRPMAKPAIEESDDRGSLLEQIRAGKALKKVEVIESSEVLDTAPDGLLGALLGKFHEINGGGVSQHREVAGSSASSSLDSDSAWDDEEDDWNEAPEGLGSYREISHSPEGLSSKARQSDSISARATEKSSTVVDEKSPYLDKSTELPDSSENSSIDLTRPPKGVLLASDTTVLDKPSEVLDMSALMAARRNNMGENDSASNDSSEDWDVSSDESADVQDTAEQAKLSSDKVSDEVKMDTDMTTPKSSVFSAKVKALGNLLNRGATTEDKSEAKMADATDSAPLDTAPDLLGAHVVDDGVSLQASSESIALTEQHISVDVF